MNAIKDLVDIVRETAYKVHVYLGVGFLEKVYENALVNRLRKGGHTVEQQVAVKALLNAHEAQLINYLKATKIKHGMLINFGSKKFEIRKFAY